MKLVKAFVFASLLSAALVQAGELKPETILKLNTALQEVVAPVKTEKSRKLLVYTRASGFVHGSIPIGAKCFEMLGKKTGAFEVTKITEDPAAFDADLNEYDAIVLMSCTGDFLKPKKPDMPKPADLAKKTDQERKKIEEAVAQYEAEKKAYESAEPARKKALLDFVANGKGLIGIHAATDAYYGWKEYGEMIGGYFNGHPWGKINIKVDDKDSPLTSLFEGKNFDFNDEIYTYKTDAHHSREKLRVLLSVDLEASSKMAGGSIKKPAAEGGNYSGENRKDHDYAVAWIKKHGKGRVFYTLLGHNDGTFMNKMAVMFFLNGIQYACGDLKADDSPSKAPAAPKPNEK